MEPRLVLSADVLTYHNDNASTGENLNETTLTPANVNVATFGKLGQVPVDGAVYAQPLYKSNVTIGSVTHNVVYVATENDSVYAFDADTLAPLWHDSFVNPAAGVTAVPSSDVKTDDLLPIVGITGTPVIDPATNALYVVTKVRIVSGTNVTYDQQLHALDLATGAEKFGAPVDLQATVPGRGVGSHRGKVSFDPKWEFQRTGLLLSNGVVYIAFASHSDNGPYHGWILGYDAQNLKQVSAFNVTPNGNDGGIWMSGAALSADVSGNLFVATGNGTFQPRAKNGDWGDSVLKLAPRIGQIGVADYFTPYNQKHLQAVDFDLGSGGVTLLPDQPGPNPHLLVFAGKEGKIYVVNRDRMGHNSGKVDKIVQEVPNAMLGTFSTPSYFNGRLYYVGTAGRTKTTPGGGDTLKAFTLANGTLSPNVTSGGVAYGYPGSTPSISANGTTNGIVWTLDNGGNVLHTPAVLRANDANDVSHELYDSSQAGTRDLGGPAVKFTVPTVVNGKVFVGGFGTLTVYGLLPPSGT